MEWAKSKHKKPAVVGSLIHLGNCFDLLDTRHTSILPIAFESFCAYLNTIRKTLPENSDDPDQLRRSRDCAVINWLLSQLETEGTMFQSVRGVFQEGHPAFAGSGIRLKSHIQIAVRDPACIVGYFRPA